MTFLLICVELYLINRRVQCVGSSCSCPRSCSPLCRHPDQSVRVSGVVTRLDPKNTWQSHCQEGNSLGKCSTSTPLCGPQTPSLKHPFNHQVCRWQYLVQTSDSLVPLLIFSHSHIFFTFPLPPFIEERQLRQISANLICCVAQKNNTDLVSVPSDQDAV